MESEDCPNSCKRQIEAANDNGSVAVDTKMLDESVFRLARLLARQIAREDFASTQVANDNSATRESTHKK
jgi:hypothetical protein